jgi:hypothetical protein
MAKLYAQIQTDKRGRVASKGGESWVQVQITDGSQTALHCEYREEGEHQHGLHITFYDEKTPVYINGERIQ